MDSGEKKEQISRRELMVNGGKMAAGAALLSLGTLAGEKTAAASTFDSSFKYVKLDPEAVARTTYENYFSRWCASSVIAGLVDNLQKSRGGESWKNFPIDAYKWAHGGYAGWGALCGSLAGAGIVIGLATKDTDVAEAMANDLAFYYSYNELPSYSPSKPIKANLKHMTVAGTPVCHISVGKWMRAEGQAFLSDARAERCARIAANIARETAIMLNAWSEGKYTPQHKPLFNVVQNGITSQNNCTDCHGQNPPSPAETYDTLEK